MVTPGRLWAPPLPTLCFSSGGTSRQRPGARLAVACVLCSGGHHCPEPGTATPLPCGTGSFSVSVPRTDSIPSRAQKWEDPKVREVGRWLGKMASAASGPGPLPPGLDNLWTKAVAQRAPQLSWHLPCSEPLPCPDLPRTGGAHAEPGVLGSSLPNSIQHVF